MNVDSRRRMLSTSIFVFFDKFDYKDIFWEIIGKSTRRGC